MEFRYFTTRKNLEEFARAINAPKSIFTKKRTRFQNVFFILFFLAAYAVFKTSSKQSSLISFGLTLCTISLIFLFVISLLKSISIKSYGKRFNELNPASITRVTESGISSTFEDNTQNYYFHWQHVQRVLESKNMFIIISKNGVCIMLPKHVLAERLPIFLQMLQTYLPHIIIER